MSLHRMKCESHLRAQGGGSMFKAHEPCKGLHVPIPCIPCSSCTPCTHAPTPCTSCIPCNSCTHVSAHVSSATNVTGRAQYPERCFTGTVYQTGAPTHKKTSASANSGEGYRERMATHLNSASVACDSFLTSDSSKSLVACFTTANRDTAECDFTGLASGSHSEPPRPF